MRLLSQTCFPEAPAGHRVDQIQNCEGWAIGKPGREIQAHLEVLGGSPVLDQISRK